MAHPLVELARKTIESYVREKRTIKPPGELVPEMQGRAGTFVSLHDIRGRSEERLVWKDFKYRWSRYHLKKKRPYK